MVDYYSFILKSDNHEIQSESDIHHPVHESFDGSIRLAAADSLLKKEMKFRVRLIRNLEVRISYENRKEIRIKTERAGHWKEFLDSNFLDVIGLIATLMVETEGENILWIEPNADESVWVLGLIRSTKHWQGMLARRVRPQLRRDYFLSGVHDRQRRAKQLLNYFESWLGPDFPFCRDVSESGRKMLTVKVNSKATWFLLFPLSHFCQFGYGYFKSCQEPEWIVTNKGFIQNTYQRLQIQKELSVVENVLQHSIIIINTYSYWEPEVIKKAQKGIALMKEVLSLFDDIRFQNDTPISLRWYLNPTYNEILHELLNPDTWYFFADFHVNNGAWQIGDGGRCSWLFPTTTNQKVLDEKKKVQLFSLDRKWDLSHQRLMRVFHCESVFNAYVSDREPADAHSIVRQLLDAGAQRVEGGMTTESFFDHLCSLFDLLCRDQGLGPILEGKCLEVGQRFKNLIHRINDYLSSCDWDMIR